METCYSRVLYKAANVAKPKPRDQNALTQREMRIRLPEIPSPHQSSIDDIDLLKHKKEIGVIFVPQDVFDTLSRDKRKEVRDLNAALRRM